MKHIILLVILNLIACNEKEKLQEPSMVSKILGCRERLIADQVLFSINDDEQKLNGMSPNENLLLQVLLLKNLRETRSKLLRTYALKKLNLNDSVSQQEVNDYLSKNASIFPSNLSKEQIFKISESHLKQEKTDQKINSWISDKNTNIKWTNQLFTCPPPLEILSKNKLKLKSNSTNDRSELQLLSSPTCTSCRALWPKIISFMKNSDLPLSFVPLPDLSEGGYRRFAKLLACLESENNTNINFKIVDELHRKNLNTLEDEAKFDEFSTKLTESTQSCLKSSQPNTFKQIQDMNTSNQPHLFIETTLVAVGYESIIEILSKLKNQSK